MMSNFRFVWIPNLARQNSVFDMILFPNIEFHISNKDKAAFKSFQRLILCIKCGFFCRRVIAVCNYNIPFTMEHQSHPTCNISLLTLINPIFLSRSPNNAIYCTLQASMLQPQRHQSGMISLLPSPRSFMRSSRVHDQLLLFFFGKSLLLGKAQRKSDRAGRGPDRDARHG